MILPLSFVVGLSMIKDILEDYSRHKADAEENNSKCRVVKKTHTQGGHKEVIEFRDSHWSDIKVGNIVKVMENQAFPCDVVMINTALAKGVCYVETKNLDGETNLKQKTSAEKLVALGENDDLVSRNLNGVIIDCEAENEFLYTF